MLPVCLGNATKVCDMLTDSDKEYRAVLLLGIRTDTQDITGQILEEKQVTAGEKEVKEAIRSFTGTQLQIPPMYSALESQWTEALRSCQSGEDCRAEAKRDPGV